MTRYVTYKCRTMESATDAQTSPPSRHVVWQIPWFLFHLAVVYAIANFCTTRLAGWTRGTLLPLLQEPTSSSRLQFLFDHLFAFSFVPAFAVGLSNARFKHRVAQFVWIVPTLVLAYKFLTFPAPSLFQSQFSAAYFQYFGGGFQIPDFRDWHDFWTIVRSNPGMARGMAQLNFVAPVYAGVGYSVAAWIGRQTNLNQKLSEKVKSWEESRFERRP